MMGQPSISHADAREHLNMALTLAIQSPNRLSNTDGSLMFVADRVELFGYLQA